MCESAVLLFLCFTVWLFDVWICSFTVSLFYCLTVWFVNLHNSFTVSPFLSFSGDVWWWRMLGHGVTVGLCKALLRLNSTKTNWLRCQTLEIWDTHIGRVFFHPPNKIELPCQWKLSICILLENSPSVNGWSGRLMVWSPLRPESTIDINSGEQSRL